MTQQTRRFPALVRSNRCHLGHVRPDESRKAWFAGSQGNDQLKQIAAKLKVFAAATAAKLLFALTTPMLNSGPVDDLVKSLNAQAAATMAAQSIATVDLHKAIIGKCGKAPQAACFGSTGCFSPHCPGNGGEGYSWLVNTTIAPAIRKLL